jgi:N-acetyl-alpha-D-glucosaminyl L-malate synthase BshA
MHYAIPHAISAFLAREMLGRKNVKIITTLHGTDITLVGLEPSFLPLMKFSIGQSDGVTAVSRFLKEKTLVSYGVEKEIEVIPNFVETGRFVRSESEHFRGRMVPAGEPIMVHVSNFRALKRVGDAIRVLAEVRKKMPVKLLLVGDGPDRAECERLTRELCISDAVIFLGKQEALVEILSASDIFIMPSQSESFGLSALEAMSCGLPAITTSVGGLPELNVHGETGFICEIGDVERMAKYAIDLFTNQAKYARFSEAARRRAVEMFDASIIIPKYEEYYERVLKGD